MKNILQERPDEKLNGRYLLSTLFVDVADIANKRILDVGCGFGWFDLFAYKSKSTYICGIEPSEADIKVAKDFFIQKGISEKQAFFTMGSALNIPCKDESFDTVVSWEVLEHIPSGEEERMFSEINRVLIPGGIFYMSTPFDNILSNLTDPAWFFGHRHYKERTIKELAAKSGFEIDEIKIIGGWRYVLWSFNMYISKWIFRRRLLFPNGFKKMLEVDSKNNGFCSIFVKLRKM